MLEGGFSGFIHFLLFYTYFYSHFVLLVNPGKKILVIDSYVLLRLYVG